MSRTYRNRSYKTQDLKNQLEYLIKEQQDFILFYGKNDLDCQRTIRFQEYNIHWYLKHYLKSLDDRSNEKKYQNYVTKHESCVLRRAGRNKLIATLKKHIDLTNLEKMDDLHYFVEPNLKRIKHFY